MTVTDSLTHSDKSNNSVGIRISICHIISYFIIRQNVVLDSLFFFFFWMGLDSLNSCPINCLIQPQFFHQFLLFWENPSLYWPCVIFFWKAMCYYIDTIMKWNINNFLEIYGSITFGPTITWTKTMSYLNYFQKKKKLLVKVWKIKQKM